jgi:hypothetical protein
MGEAHSLVLVAHLLARSVGWKVTSQGCNLYMSPTSLLYQCFSFYATHLISRGGHIYIYLCTNLVDEVGLLLPCLSNAFAPYHIFSLHVCYEWMRNMSMSIRKMSA